MKIRWRSWQHRFCLQSDMVLASNWLDKFSLNPSWQKSNLTSLESFSWHSDKWFKHSRSNKMENFPSMHESELGFETFQNYTPAEVFVQGCAGFTNQHDIEAMIRAQKQM